MIVNRQKQQYNSLGESQNIDFSKIKLGPRSLEDSNYIVGDVTKEVASSIGRKKDIVRAIIGGHLKRMRKISRVYYNTNGIYNRLCRYFAFLYRYDYYVIPSYDKESLDAKGKKKVTKIFNNFLEYLENFNFKKFFGEVALKVVQNGCYYGFRVPNKKEIIIQELPVDYCRTRFVTINGEPAVEFNMRYFREKFPNEQQREQILKVFPADFKRGYKLYLEGKLPPCFMGDTPGWYLLEVGSAFKFNVCNSDVPMLISIIPALIDLDNAQKLDRDRQLQKLYRLIIQKMPLTKNGDSVFSEEEIAAFHYNATSMVGSNPGVHVLTTFADSKVEDMSDSAAAASVDDVAKVEREVFNAAGTSEKLMNTDGNIALEKSIVNDESSIVNLLLQFEKFLNLLAKEFSPQRKFSLRVKMLDTSVYNYKDVSKAYKDLAQMGNGSKILPQVALGLSQKNILDSFAFEEDILKISDKMTALSEKKETEEKNSTEERGRPTKESLGEAVTEKTIQNREAIG